MVQFLSIHFFLGFLQFLLGFSNVPFFCFILYMRYCYQYKSNFTEGTLADQSTTSATKQVQFGSVDVAVLHHVAHPAVGNIPCGFGEINNLLLSLSLKLPNTA